MQGTSQGEASGTQGIVKECVTGLTFHPLCLIIQLYQRRRLMRTQAQYDEETRFIELAYDLMMEGEMDEDAIYDEVHRIMDKEDAQ